MVDVGNFHIPLGPWGVSYERVMGLNCFVTIVKPCRKYGLDRQKAPEDGADRAVGESSGLVDMEFHHQIWPFWGFNRIWEYEGWGRGSHSSYSQELIRFEIRNWD